MRKNSPSIDGFVPRRASSELGEHHNHPTKNRGAKSVRPEIGEVTRPITPGMVQRPVGRVSRSEIDESLSGIDEEDQPVKKRGLFRRRRNKVVRTRRQKIIRRVIIGFVTLILLVAGFVALITFLASNKVFQGNIFDIFQSQPLKMDANGRSNVLIFGTSEDDPGHEAGSLTDSIMMISIDQNNKNAYMVSIPRDLYVDYGASCVAGLQGKINSLYSCYSNDGKDEKTGAIALKKKVGEILGVDVQYYTHVNYTVVRDVVKALDGVTVDIQGSNGDPGVMDSNFDWKCKAGDAYASQATIIKNCPPNGHFIDYPNGKTKLDAEHALYLAQARGDRAPTYGLSRSNFDREVNQQKIIKAIREKAVSTSTITDVGKVTGLMDALGKNLRTDFATSEIRTLLALGQDIPSESITPLTLVEEGNELVASAMVGGASSVVPVLGTFDYTGIQAYMKKSLSSNAVVREGANVVVLNGTLQAGLAQSEADELTAAGYTVTGMDNAPDGEYGGATIYKLTKGNKGTSSALEKRYDVKITSTEPTFFVAAGTDFVVVVGKVPAKTTE